MSSNRITDFVGTELPEYAVEISMANREAKDATYNWLEDRKPTYSPQGCADGTYEVTHLGINGPMEFVIEISDDKIADVTVVSHNEVENFGTRAIDQVPGEIVAANSLDVDLVSGAGTRLAPGGPTFHSKLRPPTPARTPPRRPSRRTPRRSASTLRAPRSRSDAGRSGPTPRGPPPPSARPAPPRRGARRSGPAP